MQDPFESCLQEHPQWGPATASLYSAWWLRWTQFLDKPWPRAKRVDIEAFERALLWAPNRQASLISANTIHQALQFLRHFYRWAHRQGLVRDNPMQNWLLRKPPQPTNPPLTRTQFLALCNAPDLSSAAGQRDLVLLHFFYQGMSAAECHQFRLDQLDELPADEALAAAVEHYLQSGRPELLNFPCDTLLLSDDGPYKTIEGLRHRLRRYNSVVKRKLTPRLLSQSHRSHQAELGLRHGRTSWADGK